MGVLESPLMRVLEVNCYVARKFAVAGVVDLKRSLRDGDHRVREAVVDLEFNFLDKERQILLIDWIGDRRVFAEPAHIAAPFMRQREAVAHHLNVLPHLLSH